jgi:hypothetical protein
MCCTQGLIAASDLYGEGYVDMDEFLAAMVANSNYSKTKDAVSLNSWHLHPGSHQAGACRLQQPSACTRVTAPSCV